MKDLIDFYKIWVWIIEKWRTSFVVIAALALGFLTGSVVQNKDITDDCKFMGVFRDGSQAYNCNPRVR